MTESVTEQWKGTVVSLFNVHWTMDKVQEVHEILNVPKVASLEYLLISYCTYAEGCFRSLFSMIACKCLNLKRLTFSGHELSDDFCDLAQIFGSERRISLNELEIRIGAKDVPAATVQGLLGIRTKRLIVGPDLNRSLTKHAWGILAECQNSKKNCGSPSLRVTASTDCQKLNDFVQTIDHTNIMLDEITIFFFRHRPMQYTPNFFAWLKALVKHEIKGIVVFFHEFLEEDTWPIRAEEFSTVFLPALKENTAFEKFKILGDGSIEGGVQEIPLAPRDQRLVDFCVERNKFLAQTDHKWSDWMRLLPLLAEHGEGPGNELRPTWPAICRIVQHGLVEYLEKRAQTEKYRRKKRQHTDAKMSFA